MFSLMNDFLFFSLQVTVSGLVKVAIFIANVDAENQCLIIHKCFARPHRSEVGSADYRCATFAKTVLAVVILCN